MLFRSHAYRGGGQILPIFCVRTKWTTPKMMIETVMDDAFKNFGDEIEIRNRAVAGKIFSW